MRVLITGGAGFIGSHLANGLEAAFHEVVIVDKRLGEDHDLLTHGCIDKWLDETEPDLCLHLAARVGRLFGEDDAADTVLDNSGMTALVARACGKKGIRLAYASTSEVYGDQRSLICFEDADAWQQAGKPPNSTWLSQHQLPHNAYGLSKRHGEEFCQMYAPEGLVTFRFSMPFGAGLPAGRGRAAIINMLYQALHGDKIMVHRGAERSWCYASDMVAGVLAVLHSEKSGAWNVGRDDNPTSMRDVALLACRLTGASTDLIVEIDPPQMQTVVKRLSTHKLRALGWEPEVDLEEGMRRTLSYVEQLDEKGAIAV